MDISPLVLIPPFLVLLVALYSRKVIASLATGICSAALIACDFSPLPALKLVLTRLWGETHVPLLATSESPDHLYTFAFLIILGFIIALITHTGGIQAYTRTIQARLTGKRAVETTSLLLSLCFFIDDYLNTLTVGSMMRPLTDKFKIPRVKLAFLLDAMSSSLCILVPASSWVAMILGNLQAAGVNESSTADINLDPFYAYVQAIPFFFYPLFVFISAWFIVYRQLSFGPMHKHELEAQTTGNLYGGKLAPVQRTSAPQNTNGSLMDFFIPIGTFICSVAGILLYSGNWVIIGGTRSFMHALQTSNPFLALFLASVFTLSLSLCLFLTQHKIKPSQLGSLCLEGFMLMKNSLIVLVLAWTLSSLLKYDLHTGTYLAQVLLGSVPVFTLPVMIFITSTLISASTGSAWGTVAIMMPLAVPLVVTFSGTTGLVTLGSVPLLAPVLGALLSGSIAGGHISPISDSTVMASTSSGAHHLDHVLTQLGYMLPALLASIVSFILTGLLLSRCSLTTLLAVCLSTGACVTLSLLWLRNARTRRP